jgi:tetratricopeptide (TPR) repeat protein
MYRSSWWLAAALIGTNVALVQQVVVAKSVTEIGRTAQAITVEIRQVGSDGVGSGILLQRQGDVYTVLTAGHVVKSGSAFNVKTNDGKVHQSIANSIKLANNNIDLAVLKFRSSNNYNLAKIGASSSLEIGAPIYVGGFPAPTYAVGGGVFNFTEGRIIANANRINPLGYSLIYSNPTLSGMSGGPVLNEAGELVAIHGLGDRVGKKGELEKLGRNLGIVMETFGSEAVAMGVQLDQQITATPPNQMFSASDYFLRASVKYDKGDYKGAVSDYTEVIRLDPKNADAYNNRGLAKVMKIILPSELDTEVDNRGAIIDYNIAISINPKNAFFYNNRADAYRNLGKLKEAITDYSQAIKINPNFAEAYFERGKAYSRLGDKISKTRDFTIGVSKINPSTAQEYAWRGWIKSEYLQQYQDAILDYTQAIKINPGDVDLYQYRAMIYRYLEKYQNAIIDYTQAIKINPGDDVLYIGRAMSYEDLKQDTLAIKDYTHAINLDPENSEFSYFQRGEIYYRLDDYPKAISDFNQVTIDGCGSANQMGACLRRGIIKLELGDNKGAILEFDNLIKLIGFIESFASIESFYSRGMAKKNIGDLEGSIQDYQQVLNFPDTHQYKGFKAYYCRGLGYFGLGRIPSAIANFTEAIKLEPNKPEAYHHRGVAYQALKDRNNAIKDLKMADRLYLNENRLNKHRIVTQLLLKI